MRKFSFAFICLLLLVFPQAVIAGSFHQQVGSGFTDMVPRQAVRANDDRLYLFTSAISANTIRVYWSNQTGMVNSSTTYSTLSLNTSSRGISLDTAYDGGNIIIALINTAGGSLIAYPFNTNTKTFGTPVTLETGLATTPTDIGTSGLSVMFDKLSKLHVAYWTSANHIKYHSYNFDSGTSAFTPIGSAVQVDAAGSANHPSLAISPVDGSVVVGWVSQATNPAKIQVSIKSSGGVWGNIADVSTSPVWTSTNSGLNIDQGPSIVVGTDGKIHLVYMQNFETVTGKGNDYGRAHYVTLVNGTTWSDQSTNFFTHDPTLAITSTNQIFILGHGHPFDTSGCTRMIDLCAMGRLNNIWQDPVLIAQAQGSEDFDASVSVKWSVVGWNRPDVIEFGFFSTPYQNPTLYYGQYTPTITSSSSSSVSSSVSSSSSSSAAPPACTIANCPAADINGDHFVDISDYGAMVSNYLLTPPTNTKTDLNGDGFVDIDDYGLMVANFLKNF